MNPVPTKNTMRNIKNHARHYRGQEVLLCFLTDPYNALDEEMQRTREAINILNFHGVIPVILTKAGLKSTRDFDLLDGNGIAFIAIQKDFGAPYGRGKSFGMEKARLYLSIEKHTLKMVKAKNWANSAINPNGMELEFKLHRGCEFEVIRDWHKTDEKEGGQ